MNNIDPNIVSSQVLPVFYKWQVSTDKGISFIDMTDAPNSPSLSLTNIDSLKDDYQYRVIVTSGNSTVISRPGTLKVYPKIDITQHPVDQVAQSGNAIFSFNAIAPANTTTTYQWEYASKDDPTAFYPITGATGTVAQQDPLPMGLSLTNLTRDDDDNIYRVKILSGFNNTFKKVTYSNTAKLDILGTQITITQQPQDVFIAEDTDAVFFVYASANDGSTLSYQWQESSDNGITYTNIELETSNTLTINSLNKNQYKYRAQIFSLSATIVSDPATLNTGIELMSTSNVVDNTRMWGDPHLTLTSSRGAFARLDDNCCNTPILFFYAQYDNGDSYRVVINNRYRYPSSTAGPALISSIITTKNGQPIEPTIKDNKSTSTPSTSLSLNSCTVAGVTGWSYLQGKCMCLSTVASAQQLNTVNYAQLINNCVRWTCNNKNNPSILIISSGFSSQDNLLKTKLSSITPLANITITTTSNLFTNANNILYQKDIVILQTSYNSSGMPDIGQRALLDYVKTGGGLLTTEWTLYMAGLGRYNILQEAFPAYSSSKYASKSPIRYIQNTPNDILNNGLSDDFVFIGSGNSGTATEVLSYEAKPGSSIFYHSEQCQAQEMSINVGGMLDIIDRITNDPAWGGIYHSPIIKWQNIINYNGKVKIGGALYWILKSYIEYQKSPKDSKFSGWTVNLFGPTIDGYGLVTKPFNITRKMLSDAANAADNSIEINAVTESIDMANKFWKNMTKILRGLTPDDKAFVRNIVYIKKQPSNRLGGINGSVSFECAAGSTSGSSVSYQWQLSTNNGSSFSNLSDTSNVSGSRTSILTIKNLTTNNNNQQYRAIITSSNANNKISNPVTLNVIQSIVVSQFPTAQTAIAGIANFDIAASSTQGRAISYQWQYSTRSTGPFTSMSGQIYAKLALKVTSLSQNNTYYRVVLNDGISSFTTNPVKLTAAPTLRINIQPTNFTTTSNTATFNVSVNGTSPLVDASTAITYQWQYSSNNRTWTNITTNNVKYLNSNTPVLSLINLTRSADDKLYFRVVIRNGSVSVTSQSAQLTISPTISYQNIVYNPIYKKVSNIDYVDLTLSVTASTSFGTLTYQWQQSTNGGVRYSNIVGATSNIVGVRNIPKNSYTNYKYRVLINNSIETIMVY